MNLPMMSHQHHGIFLEENVLSNIELTNILQGTSMEKLSKRQHKRKAPEELWKSSKRKLGDDSDLLLETSSSDSTSRSTPLSQETVSEIPTPNSALGFHSDLELSGLDPSELIGGEDKSGEFDNIDELSDVEEMLSGHSKSGRKHDKSPLLMDLGDSKGFVPPSVSITPIPTSSNSPGYKQSSGVRPGIEIIPISSTTGTTLPSSITITPITSNQVKEEKIKEKKSSKNRSDDRNRLEKKKKRRREENAMGPPDKLPLKQDPLTKPVTVSIKPAESPPMTPTSPNMIRKFSPSPTQNRSLSGKLSPSMLKSSLKTSSSHHSPKHSPAHIPSSPKHTIPGISSPKSHATSPKHPSTSGSGKPSMSALKNAANSPSSKSGGESSKSKSLNKDSSRDKEKKFSSVFTSSNCAKVKLSTVKVKQLDSGGGGELNDSMQEGFQNSAGDVNKTGLGQVKNRKGNLLAVIDKLKSAQHCDSPADLSSKSSSSRERSQISGKNLESGKANVKAGETKNSEYMVKPSSDGMKITINKTRTKDSSKSLAKSGSGSPKTHTGLKPGVTSGPASKKPQHLNQKVGTNLSNSSLNPMFKSSKSTNLSVKSSGSLGSGLNKSSSKLGSPKMSSSTTDLSRNKDKQKLTKSSSEKSIFSMKESRKSSPTPNKEEGESAYKLAMSYSSPLMMEGLMKQQFDKNFQIPKLSARMADDKKIKLNTGTADSINNVKTDRSDIKFPVALLPNKLPENDKLRNNMNNIVSSSNSPLTLSVNPKLNMAASKDDFDIDRKDPKEEYKISYPIAGQKSMSEPLSLSTKSSDTSSKFIAPAPKDDKKEKCKSDSDLLLDFSNKNEHKGNVSISPYPQSPSVSVHIVKSPAPSPLINPSPHSTSPSCITDDELMDEALVGLGK